jgi:hypothetical protein
MQHIWPGQQHLQRQCPLLEAMVRRRQRSAARDIRRNRQRPELIAMLKAHDLILGGDIGQRSDQLAGILWYPALPVGI